MAIRRLFFIGSNTMGNKKVLFYIYRNEFYGELERFILSYIGRNSMGNKKVLFYIYLKEFYGGKENFI